MSPIDEETRQFVTTHVEASVQRASTDVYKRVASDIATLQDRMSTGFGELVEFRGETRTGLANVDRSLETLTANVNGVISAQQRQGTTIENHTKSCERRHKNDTDEQQKATTMANTVAALANRQDTIAKRLDNGAAKFNELENTDVRIQYAKEVEEKMREKYWKRIVQIGTVLGALGVGSAVTYILQVIIK
jgi:hypothetical protein